MGEQKKSVLLLRTEPVPSI